jgi:hypothetical protein
VDANESTSSQPHTGDLTLKLVTEWCKTASIDQLKSLNSVVGPRLRQDNRHKTYKAMTEFRVGARVYFNHTDTGEKICGSVTPYTNKHGNVTRGRKKMQIIQDETNIRWTVTAIMLRSL